ncbi:MAG: OsmC family protein [Planctomycetes bacterium]|nr:OsmC family protein [Planctomycetota bacterium]
MKATATMGPVGYRTEIKTGQKTPHTLFADEPIGKGDDTGPTPIEMLAGALASCTTLTLRSYANLKGIPLEGVDVAVEIVRRKPSELRPGERDMLIRKQVTIRGGLTQEQKDRLLQVADKCSVLKALREGVDLEIL